MVLFKDLKFPQCCCCCCTLCPRFVTSRTLGCFVRLPLVWAESEHGLSATERIIGSLVKRFYADGTKRVHSIKVRMILGSIQMRTGQCCPRHTSKQKQRGYVKQSFVVSTDKDAFALNGRCRYIFCCRCLGGGGYYAKTTFLKLYIIL